MPARRDERIQRESSGTPWVAGTRKAPETTTAGAADDRRHLRPGPRPSLSALLRQAGLCVSAFHPGAPQGRRARFMCSDSHSTTGCPRQRRRSGRTQKRPADSAQVGRRGDMVHDTDPRGRRPHPDGVRAPAEAAGRMAPDSREPVRPMLDPHPLRGSWRRAAGWSVGKAGARLPRAPAFFLWCARASASAPARARAARVRARPASALA